MNTKAGGKKVGATLRQRYGDDYWAKIGHLGGSVEHKEPRGFANMTVAQRSAAGKKGGKISRRFKLKKG